MKHLFVARHGNYGYDNRLDNVGREQMTDLSRSIKGVLGDNSAYIVSSTAPRALDSAEVLTSQLGLEGFEELLYLWEGGDAPKDAYEWVRDRDKLLEVVDERTEKADGLIVVTHFGVVRDLPHLFWNRRLEKKGEGPNRSPEKGQAAHFDLEAQTYQILPLKSLN